MLGLVYLYLEFAAVGLLCSVGDVLATLLFGGFKAIEKVTIAACQKL